MGEYHQVLAILIERKLSACCSYESIRLLTHRPYFAPDTLDIKLPSCQ